MISDRFECASPELPAALCHVPVRDADGGALRQEEVAQEVPVAIVVNGISQAVMLATPADLEDFALGFALTEGLLGSPSDLLDLECETEEAGISLQLRVTAACEARLKQRRRQLAGRTGCGLCGVESLQEVDRSAGLRVQPLHPTAEAIARAMHGLAQGQVLNQRCGGLHAAAWCDPDGRVRLVREDVGRHNALDKVIGALARERVAAWSGGDAGRQPVEPLASTGFLAITSRASVELVHKALSAGAGALATMSAPTALAVQRAGERGLTLLGFVREGRASRYT